jgi:HD superfamily phosphodiesterase
MTIPELLHDIMKIAQETVNDELINLTAELNEKVLELMNGEEQAEEAMERHETLPIVMRKDDAKQEPYCSNCWDADKREIKMVKQFHLNQNTWFCKYCKNRCKYVNISN